MMSNPGYQGTRDFNPQMGQQIPRNPNPQADELLPKVIEMMKNQFGLKPKGLTFSYKRPYLEWYDLVALPTNYRLLEFAKFTYQDSTNESGAEFLQRFQETRNLCFSLNMTDDQLAALTVQEMLPTWREKLLG